MGDGSGDPWEGEMFGSVARRKCSFFCFLWFLFLFLFYFEIFLFFTCLLSDGAAGGLSSLLNSLPFIQTPFSRGKAK